MDRVFYVMNEVSFFFVTECLAIADEKLKIAGVRLIDVRIVNFIDNPMAESEPDPRGKRVGGTQAFLCA